MKEKYLVVNCGSSSLKFSLYEMPDETFNLIDISNNAYYNYKQINKLQEECDEIKVKK